MSSMYVSALSVHGGGATGTGCAEGGIVVGLGGGRVMTGVLMGRGGASVGLMAR